MRRLNVFFYAILGGLAIGLGGVVFLSCDNKVVGALFFSIGLVTILTNGLNLYTGKICYIFDKDLPYLIDVGIIWLGNLVGTVGVGLLVNMTRFSPALNEKAAGIVMAKMSDGLLSIFILAIFCNILMFIGVDGYNRNPHEFGKYLAPVFAVVVFILSGFEHCIANMVYFTFAKAWSANTFLYLIVMTLGNAVGGVTIPLFRKLKENTDK